MSDEQKVSDLLAVFSDQILSINPESQLHNKISGIVMALSYAVERNKIEEFLNLIKPFVEKEAKNCD